MGHSMSAVRLRVVDCQSAVYQRLDSEWWTVSREDRASSPPAAVCHLRHHCSSHFDLCLCEETLNAVGM